MPSKSGSLATAVFQKARLRSPVSWLLARLRCWTACTPLFITGVLAGLIAGFTFRRMIGRSGSVDGSGVIRLLEERLLKADQGLVQFRQQLKAQSSELRAAQQQAQQTSEQAALSGTQPVQCPRIF